MRKGTKTVRKVTINSNVFYVYDLDLDITGKRKRIYARTEGELQEKIDAALAAQNKFNEASLPSDKSLFNCIKYYFRCAYGKFSPKAVERKLNLCEMTIAEKKIDKNVEEISLQEMQSFYASLSEKYSYSTVSEIDGIIKDTLKLLSGYYELQFNIDELVVPQGDGHMEDYIPSPKVFNAIFDYAVKENCIEFGYNELVIVFGMMTGVKIPFILKSKCKDIDLDNKTYCFRKYQIQLTDECVQWLKSQIELGRLRLDPTAENYNPEEFIFLTSKGTSPMMTSILVTLQRLTKRCGVPQNITTTSLYKGYIISELAKGKNEHQISADIAWRTPKQISDVRSEYETKRKLYNIED